MPITITKKNAWHSFILLALLSVATTAKADAVFNLLEQLASAPERSEENRARNQFRNPADTLNFFGLKQDMSVLEVWPAHGWYTEILAPFLKDDGKLTLAQFRHNDGTLKNDRSIFWAKVSQRLHTHILNNPKYFGNVDFIELDPPLFNPLKEEQFDMVLSFRNAHIWNEDGHLYATLRNIFLSLKPGGVLGMVEHRASSVSDISSSAVSGYLDENYVINVAIQAGFEFIANSEINANPMDTKNYPKGVYALPPTFAMGKIDKEKYLAIGESDRMTLKFIKPSH